MVAMDGANALFKVVLNSRESQDVLHEDLIAATTTLIV